jgi:hypothetical protein
MAAWLRSRKKILGINGKSIIMSNNNSSSGGIGFFGILGIVFIVLKLCKVIDWSWWWVTCPFWGPAALFIIGVLFYLPFKIWAEKDKHNRLESGYKRTRLENGGKSKWQQRLDDMQKAQELRQKK